MTLKKLPPVQKIDWNALLADLKPAVAAFLAALLARLQPVQAQLKAEGVGDCCPDEAMCHILLCQQDHLVNAICDNVCALDHCCPPEPPAPEPGK